MVDDPVRKFLCNIGRILAMAHEEELISGYGEWLISIYHGALIFPDTERRSRNSEVGHLSYRLQKMAAMRIVAAERVWIH